MQMVGQNSQLEFKRQGFLRFRFVLATGLLCAVASTAQQRLQPLTQMTPATSSSRVPNRDTRPQLVARQTFHGKTDDALRMFSDADVTYAIPSGATTFAGVVAFNDYRSYEPNSAGALARLFLRFVVDSKLAMSIAMDHQTPLMRFSVPVAGGHSLTIAAGGEFASDFYLSGAGFSANVQNANNAYVLAPGEGYVSVASEPRHTMYHAYYPNETVTLRVASGSPLPSAEVELRVTPEQAPSTAAEFHATVPMHANGDGTYEGTTSWKVPEQRGPAQLDISAETSDRVIYREQRRIAIIAQNNLATVSDSLFGIHTSTGGYLVPQDEFASIWGAKWARVVLRWPMIEQVAGKYDFSYIEPVLDAYRGQNMRILAVLGENAPSWAGQVGSEYYAAWKRWVAETVRHLQPRVDAWDLFNEIDVKYYGSWRAVDPNADLEILQAGIDAIRSVSGKATIVCCSTGTYSWLTYDTRIFDAGILKQIDVVSVHPYMQYAPESKDPEFNYPEKLSALEQLIRSYGQSTSDWATEANWIMGPRGAPDVTAADIDEHTYAQYVVRVNLLTAVRTVPYFTHMPMNHHNHLQLQLDALSGFANVTSLLSTAKSGARSLAHTPGVWAFAWNTRDGVVGALWTERGKAEASISGLAGARFLDMYGNPIDTPLGAVSLSADPIYFVASSGASPTVDVKSAPGSPQWTALAALSTWKRVSTSRYSEMPSGLHIVSDPTTFGYQLISPTVSVQPDKCYLGRIDFRLNHGGIAFVPQDAVSSTNLSSGQVGLWSLDNGVPQQAVIRFRTDHASQVKFILTGNNPYSGSVTDFIVSAPMIAPCPE